MYDVKPGFIHLANAVKSHPNAAQRYENNLILHYKYISKFVKSSFSLHISNLQGKYLLNLPEVGIGVLAHTEVVRVKSLDHRILSEA